MQTASFEVLLQFISSENCISRKAFSEMITYYVLCCETGLPVINIISIRLQPSSEKSKGR